MRKTRRGFMGTLAAIPLAAWLPKTSVGSALPIVPPVVGKEQRSAISSIRVVDGALFCVGDKFTVLNAGGPELICVVSVDGNVLNVMRDIDGDGSRLAA